MRKWAIFIYIYLFSYKIPAHVPGENRKTERRDQLKGLIGI